MSKLHKKILPITFSCSILTMSYAFASGPLSANTPRNALTPVSKGKLRRYFTPTEDRQLCALVEQYGIRDWELITSFMPGRSERQCRDRWANHLAPTLNFSDWTPEEDAFLLAKAKMFGTQWAQIKHFFPGRTDMDCKNRWNLLNNRQLNGTKTRTSRKKQRPLDLVLPLPSLRPRGELPLGNRNNPKDFVPPPLPLSRGKPPPEDPFDGDFLGDNPESFAPSPFPLSRGKPPPEDPFDGDSLGDNPKGFARPSPLLSPRDELSLGDPFDGDSLRDNPKGFAPLPFPLSRDELSLGNRSDGDLLGDNPEDFALSPFLSSRDELPLGDRLDFSVFSGQNGNPRNLDTSLETGNSATVPIVVKPKRKISLWIPTEDQRLRALVEQYGAKNWQEIASRMPGRNARQCRERWRNYVNPELNPSPWTPQEDNLLLRKFSECGKSWYKIASFFQNRSVNSCKNRLNFLLKHKQQIQPMPTSSVFSEQNDFFEQNGLNYENIDWDSTNSYNFHGSFS
jgi:hypothetical protein